MARVGGRDLCFYFVIAVLAACGRSERRESDSPSRSGAGGTSGESGASGAESTGGTTGDACTPGETQACLGPGRCDGAQSCLADGSGWEACDCGSAGTGGTSGRGGSGGEPNGGAAGDPFGMCPMSPLPFGTTCSFDATCAELDCGSATSLYDRGGCLRKQCRSSDDCAAGERCLPAPVALEIRDCWPSGCEGCDESEGACACSCYDDCVERAVCVPLTDFPKADDCPTDGLTCAEVRGALVGVEAYLDPPNEPFTGDALAALESCHDGLLGEEPHACDFCEIWNGSDLSDPSTPAEAISRWSPSACGEDTVGVARGCDLTVVFLSGQVDRPADWVIYFVYDQTDRLVGVYQLGPGSGGCDRTTMRTGKQIECFDAISDWCDPTLRQLFFLDQQVACPTIESCKVCGSSNLPQCEDPP